MNKGIVMEMTKKSIIVMRPDGTFDRLPRRKRECEIGEEIEYAEPRFRWRTPSAAGKSALVAAVVFGMVLFASLNGKLYSSDVVAYISMDINPSVEMGIDARETVLELKGLNEDGSRLVQSVHFKGKTLEDVTEELLDQAEHGVLSQGEAEIVIASTVLEESEHFSDLLIAEKVKQTVSEHIQETHPERAAAYQVAVFAAPQEVREAAKQNGVSMGKYSVYLTAKSNGAQVTLDEIKQTSVLQLTKNKPEIAKLIMPDKTPTKDQIRQWVEEEKNGRLGVFAGDSSGNPKNPTDGQTENPDGQNGGSEGNNQKDGVDQKGELHNTSSDNSSDSAAAGSEASGAAPGGNGQPGATEDDKSRSGNAKNNDGRGSEGLKDGDNNGSDRKGRPASTPSAWRQDRGGSSEPKPGIVFPGALRPAAFGDAADIAGIWSDSRDGKAGSKKDQEKSKEEERQQKEERKRNEASLFGQWQKRSEASPPGLAKKSANEERRETDKEVHNNGQQSRKPGESDQSDKERRGKENKLNPNSRQDHSDSGSRNGGNRAKEDQGGQHYHDKKQDDRKDEKMGGKNGDSQSGESGRKAGERDERGGGPESPWRNGGTWSNPNDAPRGGHDGKSGSRDGIEAAAA